LRYALREPFDRMFNLTNRLEWQAMIDEVRSDPAMRMIVIKNFPVWKDPVKVPFRKPGAVINR
jgi:hypothetical protein